MYATALLLVLGLSVPSFVVSTAIHDTHDPMLSTADFPSLTPQHRVVANHQNTQNAWDNCKRAGLKVLCCNYSRSVNGAIRDPDGKFSKDCIAATRYRDCAQTDGDGYRVKYDHGPYCCNRIKKGRLSCAEINLGDPNSE